MDKRIPVPRGEGVEVIGVTEVEVDVSEGVWVNPVE